MNRRMLLMSKLPSFCEGDVVNITFEIGVDGTRFSVDAVLQRTELVCRVRGDGTLEIYTREWV